MLNHVLLHQTIIGLEAKKQLQAAGEKLPDIVIGCAGGGSNFAGLAFPFAADKINGAKIEIIPVEPAACPTMTRGAVRLRSRRHGLHDAAAGDAYARARVRPAADSCRRACAITAWRRSFARHRRRACSSRELTSRAECYEAAMTWARTEGSICAPETSHAIAAVIDEAEKAAKKARRRSSCSTTAVTA